ncbi:GNAT family N-acetyltransferase [Streptomyces sp. AV19]|uniref:GNAT family N-acetyltransferase n=1 Tax=Streptomyces sp. AV19 TaxID=2793068 RepID=UPI0018FECB33|nr:GNAT family N-acetyltransferase [Streptomyces sp. AV19]MBH1936708.1 GNAT family N-acetyltransferase [Streptomyces sp. AV19]MDG4532767.1 GNAT family N-acetyltransferase [Streptomyces sp. AV19]
MKVISLGFRTDLMLRAMAGSVLYDRPDHLVVRTPANPAFRWGNFVLLDRPPGPGDGRRREALFHAEFPGAAYLALGVDGTDGDTGDAAELARLGVTAEVSTVLTAARPAPPGRPLPAGAEVRPLAGDEDWARAAELRAAMDGPEPTAEHRQFVERRVAEPRRLCEAGHGTWFGAFVGGRMRAGAGIFADGGGTARYQNVETHPGFRGRGLASHLVHLAGRRALDEGARALVIVADPDYHAIRIYRALGFTDTERQVQLTRLPGE